MVSSRYGARLSQTDVVDLDTASAQLVVVADTIRRANPTWGEAAVNLLIAVNLVVVRIQNKGAAAFARYLEKRGLETRQEVMQKAGPSEEVREALKTPPNDEEG